MGKILWEINARSWREVLVKECWRLQYTEGVQYLRSDVGRRKPFEMHEKDGAIDRIAFMAMQYNDSKHNKIYHEHFKPAVAQTGFELRRLDEKLRAGLIDDQLRIEIRKCRFLLADLTKDNLGAYWEAGYAEGLGKPIIYLCEQNHFENYKTHFDTNHHTTVIWDENNIEQALNKLKATIRATLPAEAKMTDD